MKISLITLITLFVLLNTAHAQDKKPIFIGIQPSITVEPHYPEGELDANVLPFVVQFPIGKRLAFRATSMVNYHFGDPSGLGDVGLQTAMPIFYRKNEMVNQRQHGFYLAPVLGFGRNILFEHGTLTTAGELGYLWEADNRFTVALCFQLGGSYFIYDNQENIWRNHFGFKVNLGFWID